LFFRLSVSMAAGWISNGTKGRTSAGSDVARKGDSCVGSNNVTSSSDSLMRCVVDSSTTVVSDKVKLTVSVLNFSVE